MSYESGKRGPAVFDLSDAAVTPLPELDGGVYPKTGDPLMDMPYVTRNHLTDKPDDLIEDVT